MNKSFVSRALQITSAVAVYSATNVWASTKHIDIVSSALTNVNSLLVILAIAFALPYFCFKAFSKLYTPPASQNLDDLSKVKNSKLRQDELDAISNEEIETMQYRGIQYKNEDLVANTKANLREANLREANLREGEKSQPVIKYRGVNIENNANSLDSDSQEVTDSFLTERNSQKSAKPKKRMKYRGSYVD